MEVKMKAPYLTVCAISLAIMAFCSVIQLPALFIAAKASNQIETKEEYLRRNTYAYKWIKENCGQAKADRYYQYLRGAR